MIEEQAAIEQPVLLPGVYYDGCDPTLDVTPVFSKCYSIGEQIRRSREGLESNFMSDIVDYDKDPNAYDPYADIRSTFDERQEYSSALNKEKRERHEAKVEEPKVTETQSTTTSTTSTTE